MTPEQGFLVTEINAICLFCDCGLTTKNAEIKKTCFDRAMNAFILVNRFQHSVTMTAPQRLEFNNRLKEAKRKLDLLAEQFPPEELSLSHVG